jgi:chromosome segregation ATPase
MNKHKLARSLGFHHWNDLVMAATEAKALRAEVLALRAQQAPLEARMTELDAERAALASERRQLEQGWAELIALCASLADDFRQTSAAHANCADIIEARTKQMRKESSWTSD